MSQDQMSTDYQTDSPTEYLADELLTDSAQHLFATTCTFDAVQAAEHAGWSEEIWQAVAGAGFCWIGLPEAAGGSGGTLLDACEVVRLAGAHAAPVPLAETAMLGGWLLSEAGIALPEGPVTTVPGLPADSVTAASDGPSGSRVVLNGVAHRVPWAARSDLIAILLPDVGGDDTDGAGGPAGGAIVAAVEPAEVEIETVTNVAGEPRETVRFHSVAVPAERIGPVDGPVMAELLRLRGALSRVMLMAGALEAMSALTVDYTGERQQFGRPIGRFQAVQHHLVWGAQDAAITKMAAQVAAGKASVDLIGARFQIAAARTVADEAAATATRAAHQAHGAMGMTQEYALHHLSRRLWSWRREHALRGEWEGVVGRMAEAAGPDGLYPLIAS